MAFDHRSCIGFDHNSCASCVASDIVYWDQFCSFEAKEEEHILHQSSKASIDVRQ